MTKRRPKSLVVKDAVQGPDESAGQYSHVVPDRDERAWLISCVAFVLILSFFAYLPELKGEFLWDDDALTDNPLIRSADGIQQIWLEPSKNVKEEHYWPLVYSTFWVENRLWGMNPLGYKLTNFLLHLLNTALIGVALRRLAVPGAWLAAAIFCLHPFHVASVAWVIERKDTLSTALYLLAFLSYLEFDRRRSGVHYALAIAFFMGAMLSKSVAVTLPFALALVIWWKRNPARARDFTPLVPFMLLALFVALLDVSFVRSHSSYSSGMNMIEKILVASRGVFFYLLDNFAPAGLVQIYPRWMINWHLLQAYAFPVAVTVLLLLLWNFRGRLGKGPLVATLFFVITLAPSSGLVDFGYMRHTFVADRFAYLASVGPTALVAAAMALIAMRLNGWLPHVAKVAGFTLLLALGLMTYSRSMVYKNLKSLSKDTLAKNPDAWLARFNLASVLYNEGKLEEAYEHLSEVAKRSPEFPKSYLGMAMVRQKQGRIDESIELYKQAVEKKSEFPDPLQYASALTDLGQALLKQGKANEAYGYLKEAAALRPDDPDNYFTIGTARLMEGQLAEAERSFEEAITLRPNFPKAISNIGVIRIREGRTVEAISYFSQALQLDPSDRSIQDNLEKAKAIQEALDRSKKPQ